MNAPKLPKWSGDTDGRASPDGSAEPGAFTTDARRLLRQSPPPNIAAECFADIDRRVTLPRVSTPSPLRGWFVRVPLAVLLALLTEMLVTVAGGVFGAAAYYWPPPASGLFAGIAITACASAAALLGMPVSIAVMFRFVRGPSPD